jgi:probable addiction module antidote protein
MQRGIGMSTKKKEHPRSSDYKTFLMKRIRDPKMAAGYLTASLEEGNEAFLLAIRDVAEAQGGISSLAKATSLNREGLYDMLSENGNPRLSSLSTLLDALGLKVEFAAKRTRKSERLGKS